MPERTKGYFTSHLNAVSKVLHGYHVQITARSDADLEPASVLQKIADASGSKYTVGGSAPVKPAGGAPPPVKSKPVFPTTATGTISFNPIVAARNAQLRQNTNDDGWGDDAPQVSRTQLEKVEPAYKPTKVNMAELTSQKQEPSRSAGAQEDDRPGVVRGAYQPVGKVDIAAIRAAAKEKTDDRPTTVKGAYEPVGKVDIAAIRAKAQKPTAAQEEQAPEQPKPVAERTAAFSQPPQSERMTEMPKPKVANKFSGASSFTGTKPLNPGGFGLLGPTATGSSGGQLGTAGRKFADSAGKTPAQLWAEKKAAQGGGAPSPAPAPAANPVSPQVSGQAGGWKSGYSGKSWAPVQPPTYSKGIAGQKTGETATSQEERAPASPSGGVGSIRDRFKGAAPIGAAAGVGAAAGIGAGAAAYAANRDDEDEESGPPPPPMGTRPNEDAPQGGFALPGLPSRPPPPTDEEEEEEPEPIQVAMPVARGPEPELEPAHEPPRSLPVRPIEQELPREGELQEEEEVQDPRASAAAVAQEQFGQDAVTDVQGAASGGHRALIQYDYEKAEDNELELREGEYVTNIEMVDEDWWMGTNSMGESGLFPSNYVELVEEEEHAPAPAPAASMPPPPPPAAAEPEPAQASGSGPTATAQFDYEAAEDNGKCIF